jgi:hypothetical protein
MSATQYTLGFPNVGQTAGAAHAMFEYATVPLSDSSCLQTSRAAKGSSPHSWRGSLSLGRAERSSSNARRVAQRGLVGDSACRTTISVEPRMGCPCSKLWKHRESRDFLELPPYLRVACLRSCSLSSPPLVPSSEPSVTGARACRIATSGDYLAPATPSPTSAPFRRQAGCDPDARVALGRVRVRRPARGGSRQPPSSGRVAAGAWLSGPGNCR